MTQPRSHAGTAASPTRQVWRAAPGTITLVAVFLVIVVVVVPLLALSVFRTSNPGIAALLLALTVLSALYAWRFGLHPALVARPDRLTIRNPLRTRRVAWQDIRSIEPGPDGLRITAAGTVHEAWCVQKSLRALRSRQRSRADAVAEELLLYRARALERPAATAPSPPAAPRRILGSEHEDRPRPRRAAGPTTPTLDDDRTLVLPRTAARAADPSHASSEAPSDAPFGPPPEPPVGDRTTTLLSRVLSVASDELDVLIRRAPRDSHDLLARLERDAGRPDASLSELAEAWRPLLDAGAVRVRVAEIDDTPVGYLAYDGGEIHRLAVVTGCRRRGIGTQLLVYAEQDARRGGHPEIGLWVPLDDPLAYAFGHACGLSDTGERRDAGPGVPSAQVRLARPVQRA